MFNSNNISVYFNVVFETIEDYDEIKFNINLTYEDEVEKSRNEQIYKDYQLNIYAQMNNSHICFLNFSRLTV